LQQLKRPVGQNLIHIHIRRCARASLQGIDDYVPVQMSLGHFQAGRCYGRKSIFLLTPSKPMISTRTGKLDQAECMHQAPVDQPAAYRKIFDSPLRMDAVQSLRRNLPIPK
jgi:hypothetical protein